MKGVISGNLPYTIDGCSCLTYSRPYSVGLFIFYHHFPMIQEIKTSSDEELQKYDGFKE